MDTSSTLAKFLRLPAGAKLTLMEIACVTALIELGLRVMPFRWVWAVARRLPTARRRRSEPTLEELHRLARAVWRRWPIALTCLPQSLTLLVLLKRRGLAAELKIGAKTAGGRLRAHAWLEYHGRTLLETPDVAGRFPAVLSLATVSPTQ